MACLGVGSMIQGRISRRWRDRMGQNCLGRIAMAIAGTVVNGLIVLDGSPWLPEGARVQVEFTANDLDNVGPPSEPYDREAVLASLREGLEDVKAGRGRPFDEVMAEIAREFNLP